MFMHGSRIVSMDVAMTRQYPFEFITQKLFHRARLFGPRVPGYAAKRRQRLSCRRPREVIAGEEKLVAVEKDDVTACVSRRGNDEKIVVKLYWFFSADYTFRPETPRAIVCVHDSFAVEPLAKQLVRGNVVFMCEHHSTDAAHRFDPLHKLTCKSRRVDQDVAAFAIWSSDQIAPRAEA